MRLVSPELEIRWEGDLRTGAAVSRVEGYMGAVGLLLRRHGRRFPHNSTAVLQGSHGRQISQGNIAARDHLAVTSKQAWEFPIVEG